MPCLLRRHAHGAHRPGSCCSQSSRAGCPDGGTWAGVHHPAPLTPRQAPLPALCVLRAGKQMTDSRAPVRASSSPRPPAFLGEAPYLGGGRGGPVGPGADWAGETRLPPPPLGAEAGAGAASSSRAAAGGAALAAAAAAAGLGATRPPIPGRRRAGPLAPAGGQLLARQTLPHAQRVESHRLFLLPLPLLPPLSLPLFLPSPPPPSLRSRSCRRPGLSWPRPSLGHAPSADGQRDPGLSLPGGSDPAHPEDPPPPVGRPERAAGSRLGSDWAEGGRGRSVSV